MGFFDEDGFGIEEFFKNFNGGENVAEYTTVGSDGKKRTMRNTPRNSKGIPAKQVVSQDEVFFIFDFSGENNVHVEVGDELVSNNYGEKVSTGQKVLNIKSSSKDLGNFVLSKKIKLKTLEFTFNNGILEVSFKK
ncbi:hypothetical protein HN832_00230 [archaeon]|jgi:hypothetical protein|nr:hypothetical protein [archaeon]MBT4373670.1 hypothetical protein [archaeon]MBT4531724.1 hypothetical protein [archaeon]MBT7001836.1 hypothetical protein [archaeon]MBT7281821.1 hypothetical protein [archaeon]